MYDTGEANVLGNARYQQADRHPAQHAATQEDLDIIARAASHVDIENGPRTYGAARLAIASQTLAA